MLTDRQWALLRSIDRRELAAASVPVFTIDGEDFTARATECVYSGDDKVAFVLEATVALRLPPRYERKECRVDFEVEGETLPGFLGNVVSLRRVGQQTYVKAYTKGYEAGRTPIGNSENDDREYHGTRPDTALYDALSILRYKGIEVGPFPTPQIRRTGTDAISWVENVSKILEMVEEEARIKTADKATGIASAYKLSPVTRESAPIWDFEEGRDTDDIEDETSDEERYSKVLVYRQDEAGINRKLAEAAIDNRGHRVPFRSAIPVPMSEDSTDSGYAVAYEEAMRRGRNDVGITVPTAYPPFFLDRGAITSATTKEYLTEGVRNASHSFRLTSVSVDALNRKGQVSGEGIRTNVEVVPLKRARFASSGGFVRPLFGFDTDAAAYFDTSLPWFHLDPETGEAVFDINVAQKYGVAITQEGDTVIVSG